jgi:hypothetical protein
MSTSRPFAIVTGASTGIGLELAKRCANDGYDLLIAADGPEIEPAVRELKPFKPTLQPPKASMSFMPPQRDVRSTRFWRTPEEVSVMLFWTRISERRGGSSIPISLARSISSIRSGTTCGAEIREEF